MFPPSTITSPVCMRRTPAMIPSKVGLANPVRADQPDHLLRGKIETDPLQRYGLSITLGNALKARNPLLFYRDIHQSERVEPVGFQRSVGTALT